MPACSRRSNRGDSARDVTTTRTPGTGYGTDAKSSDFKSDFLSCIEITEIIVTLKLHETDRIFIFWRLLWSLTFPYVTQKVRYIFFFLKKVFLSSVNTQTVSRQLLVFGVTPFKIDQNKNQKLSIDKVQNLGNKKEVNMQRPSPRFMPEDYFCIRDIRRSVSQN